MNCPLCKNGEHVYFTDVNRLYGEFVLCSVHGIQTLEDKNPFYDFSNNTTVKL
jgi:hypothetical protein